MHRINSSMFLFRAARARALSRWRGEIQAPGNAIEFFADFPVPTAEAAKKATVSIPVQHAHNLPVDVLHKPGEEMLRFKIVALKAEFEAEVSTDGTAVGTFRQATQQGDVELGLTMRLLADSERVEAPARPQHPTEPFPYDVEEVEYKTAEDSCKIVGTLTLPRGDGQAPAVLLLTGSGSHDRDETIFGHKPFLVLADALTRRGIAVLRVDDRGIGGSAKGTAAFVTETFAQDALDGAAFLRAHPRVNSECVGFLGHSEGGLTAAIAAAEATEGHGPAFIISLGGPGVNGRETILSQNAALFSRHGASEAQVDLVVKRLSAVLDRVEDGDKIDDMLGEAKALVEAQMSASGASTASITEESVRTAAASLTLPWMQRFIALDPCEYLVRVRCPVLALIGTKDLQVLHHLHLPQIAAAVRKAGVKCDALAVEGLNHLFQRAETGLIDEYGEIEHTMDEDVIKRIGDWILDVVCDE